MQLWSRMATPIEQYMDIDGDLYRDFGPDHPSRLRDVRQKNLLAEDDITSQVIDIFLSFLQEFFATADIPDHYRYARGSDGEPDLKNSRIVIVNSDNLDFKIAAGRPVIETALGGYVYLGLGMNQFLFTNLVDPSRKKIFKDMVTGQLVINVYSKNKGEASSLGRLVQQIVTYHRETICRMGLHAIDPRVQVGQPQPMVNDSDPSIMFVPVILTWYKSDTWSTEYTSRTPTAADMKFVTSLPDESYGTIDTTIAIDEEENP